MNLEESLQPTLREFFVPVEGLVRYCRRVSGPRIYRGELYEAQREKSFFGISCVLASVQGLELGILSILGHSFLQSYL